MKRILTTILLLAALALPAYSHGASIPPPPDMDVR